MYNKYLSEDREAFADLYRPVENEEVREEKEVFREETKKKEGFELKRLLHGIDIDKAGFLPIVLLLLLLMDVDDDEKLIIVALAVIFGI